jgi:ADP-dependent NAD(P)H-hydrate dehydratase
MSRSPRSRPAGGPLVITPALLRRWPLPQPDHDGDKEARGRVLVVGGAREMPGAVLLAAVAALRAGAGKLQIATPQSIAPWVATAVPESRVVGLSETRAGAVDLTATDLLVQQANEAACVLIGPGLLDEAATAKLVRALLPRLVRPTVVLDAAALPCLGLEPAALHRLGGNAVITPHAGEMASCLGAEKAAVAADPLSTARRAAGLFRCVVALKGAETILCTPEGECYRNCAGNVGLATSGSGDTLAGIVAGLAARGVEPLHAAVWGVYLHAKAGEALARKIGPLGFLARELLDEVPRVMARLARERCP